VNVSLSVFAVFTTINSGDKNDNDRFFLPGPVWSRSCLISFTLWLLASIFIHDFCWFLLCSRTWPFNALIINDIKTLATSTAGGGGVKDEGVNFRDFFTTDDDIHNVATVFSFYSIPVKLLLIILCLKKIFSIQHSEPLTVLSNNDLSTSRSQFSSSSFAGAGDDEKRGGRRMRRSDVDDGMKKNVESVELLQIIKR
jgi:hypothetical protein